MRPLLEAVLRGTFQIRTRSRRARHPRRCQIQSLVPTVLRSTKTFFLLRRREIVPRLVAARICDSRALGLRSEAAVWRMGDGSQLAIAANFAAEPVPMTCPMGRLLFESPIGSGDAAALGTLTARAAAAFLAGPVCQLSERSLKCLRIACEFAAPGAVARAEKIRSRPAGLFRRRCRVEG